jgi:hypothetical protein
MKNPELFNDVENTTVQAYNRAITAVEVHKSEGEKATREYFDNFSEKERTVIAAMLMSIQANPDETKKRVGAIINASTH